MGGDIIPKVLKTIKPAKKDKIGYPTVPYRWNKSKVEFVIDTTNADAQVDHELLVKRLVNFCQKMDIKHVSKGLLERFVTHGVQSIHDLINLTKQQLMDMDGIQDRSSDKILHSIQGAIINVPIEQVMVASNCFGSSLGTKKLKIIATSLPMIDYVVKGKKVSIATLMSRIVELDGFSTKSAQEFIDGFDDFKQFMKNNPTIIIATNVDATNVDATNVDATNTATQGNKFKGFVVVFSGVRDKALEKFIEDNGGRVTNTISKETTHLVVADVNGTSGKITKARGKNIPILTLAVFQKKYNY